MKKIFTIILLVFLVSGCQPLSSSSLTPSKAAITPSLSSTLSKPAIKVLAVETFLMDITRNITGDLVQVDSLMPIGLDPHAFEATPQDILRINACDVLIINGSGLEEWLEPIIQNAGGHFSTIEASFGLKQRKTEDNHQSETPTDAEGHSHEGDPHFWLDPISVIQYVENIRDGLEKADPTHAVNFQENARIYIQKLKDLDSWIRSGFESIPPAKRLLVTNHESFNYFADRYGFTVVGAVIPSVSTNSSPSALQMAKLIDQIRSTGARAIFLETGANPQLAEQISQETGVKIAPELFSHSITPPDGAAPTYLEMMRYNATTIKAALTNP